LISLNSAITATGSQQETPGRLGNDEMILVTTPVTLCIISPPALPFGRFAWAVLSDRSDAMS